MTQAASSDLQRQIDENSHERSNALREIDALKSARRELLLGNAPDKEIAAHDANVARLRRVVDRCDVRLAELQKALLAAEEAEQARAVADLREHALRLAARYRDLAEGRYLQAAQALVGVLRELDRIRVDFERATTALPTSAGVPRIEEFRRTLGNSWRLPDFCEGVRLPGLKQADRPMWGEDSRAPTFNRPYIRPPDPTRPEWNPPPVTASRPNEQAELRKIHDRAHAEGRRTTSSPE